MEKNYYQLLSVHPESTASAIRKAYYKFAQQHHPDRQEGSKKDTLGSEDFARITQAFNVLKDPKRREEYDRQLNRELINNRNQAVDGTAKSSNKPKGKAGIASESFDQGMSALDQHQYGRAFILFEAAAKNNSDIPDYWSFMGLANMKNRGKLSDSVAWARKAIAAQPFNLLFKFNIVEIYLSAGAKSQAQHYLEEILKIDPENSRANRLMADILPQEKDKSFLGSILRLFKKD